MLEWTLRRPISMRRSVPTSPRLPRALARALVLGVLAGVAVGWFVSGTFPERSGAAHWLFCVGMGMLYALALAATELTMGRWLRDTVPLRSPRAVAVHVGGQALAALAAFSTVSVLLTRGAGVYLPFPVLAFIGLLAVAIVAVSHSVTSLGSLHRQIQATERAAAEAELRALRAQINPHFLFNSLNSIACFVRSRPAEAEAVTENLAELFRYSLRASQLPAVTLEEELVSVQTYLAIERARFGARLQVAVEAPEELRTARVPSLLLQPLVENAVKHGVQQSLDDCAIEVRAERAGEEVRVRVTDSGPGFTATDLEAVIARGTGLGNVRERLRHLFGAAASLRILPQGVEVSFPLELAGGAPRGTGRTP
jgi:signal transduction histidine kinase